MCIFVNLCVDETLFYVCEYSDAIKLPKSYSPPPPPPPPLMVTGTGYRLSHFWLAIEVTKEVKKNCSNTAYKNHKNIMKIRNILYRKVIKNPHNCHVSKFFT